MYKTITLASSLLLLCPVQLTAQNSVPAITPLFAASEAQPAPGVGVQPALQRRLVRVDSSQLRSPGAAALRLDLFGSDYAVAHLERVESAYAGGHVWIGAFEGGPESDAVLSVVGDAVSGSIWWHDRMFRVTPAGNGVHWLLELDPESAPPCGIDELAEEVVDTPAGSGASQFTRDQVGQAARPGSAAAAGGSNDAPRTAQAILPVVDLLVAYTTQAKNSRGGTNAMNSLINLAITETNQAYNKGGVTQQVALVHSVEMVGYTEVSSMSTMLSQLRSKTDGKMDNVHALRDQYGADAVSLLVRNSQYCGIASLMSVVSPNFENRAFSVVSAGCATGYYSFGHELGHNCGCAHDRANGSGGAYSYSYGFRTSNNRYRTVMAYSPGTRVKVFSGPNSVWSGYVMGNANTDNSRSLNNTAATVSAWRTAAPKLPPTLTSIMPAETTSYQPTEVTLTGTDLEDVTAVDIGGTMVTALNKVDANTLKFTPPPSMIIAGYAVTAINSIGSSNALNFAITGTHPSLLTVPPVHPRGFALNYVVHTDSGSSALYLFSTQNSPSAVPGLVSLAIGANFTSLYQVATVVADNTGVATMSINWPIGVNPVPLYWQAITYDLPIALPLEASNSAQSTIF